MKRAVLASLFVLLPFAAGPFAADLNLPSKFAGKTVAVRGASVNVSWSMTVDEVTSDGTVRGKMTYRGTVCGADNADYTAKLSTDGKTLTIPMPFSGGVFCQGFVFQFTRKDGTSHFEGTHEGQSQRGSPYTLKITLDPAQ